jgi:hypothetical protein
LLRGALLTGAAYHAGKLFEVDKTTNLATIFPSVLEEFRQRYLTATRRAASPPTAGIASRCARKTAREP